MPRSCKKLQIARQAETFRRRLIFTITTLVAVGAGTVGLARAYGAAPNAPGFLKALAPQAGQAPAAQRGWTAGTLSGRPAKHRADARPSRWGLLFDSPQSERLQQGGRSQNP